VPATANGIVALPFAASGLSNAPLFAVTVCATGSWLVQVTLSPRLIVVGCGPNDKFFTTTVWVAANAALGIRAQMAMRNAATRSVRLRRIR